nr:MFS transporter [Candidatus Njordarchaeota archaeon]
MVLLSFILAMGRNLAVPFLTKYLDGGSAGGALNFDSSLVGFLMMIGGFSYLLVLPLAGSLCDRFGRRKMMATFIIPQVILFPAYAYAKTYLEFLLLHASVNAVGAFYDPSYSAMVADLVKLGRREEVFGLSYMISNIATIVGPPIGGTIAGESGYPILFVYATFFIAIGVAIFSLFIKESRPREVKKEAGTEEVKNVSSQKLTSVFRDKLFMVFCITAASTNIVYSRFYDLLAMYTGDVGFSDYYLGLLYALNGAMVVTLQIPIRKGAMRLGATRAFILAQLLFTAGFAYFMIAVDFSQFLVADVVLTLGEITFFPSSSGFVADLAPPDLRGRYMAVMGLFFGIGSSTSSFIVLSVYGELKRAYQNRLIWGFLGLVGFATLSGYVALSRLARRKRAAEK